MDGFEVLRSLKGESLPLVIFVTAYDQHAVKAFEVHALDYLLKPFKPARFKETVARAIQTLALRQTEAATQNLLQMLARAEPAREYLTRIPVRTGDRIVVVRSSQVEYIEAAGNYAILHVGKESHILRETLTSLEEKLDPRKFLRINRSTIVSLDQIKEFRPLFKGEHAVVLQNGKQFTMTRGLREAQELLKFA
jgi:two-component system LytT family response regulator